MSSLTRTLSACLAFAILILPIRIPATLAQSQSGSQWSFGNVDPASTVIDECQSITFNISQSLANKPPFSIWIWAAFGSSNYVSQISGQTRFNWTVVYPRDTPTAFTLLDSEGNSMGTSRLFTIGASSNQACLQPYKRATPLHLRLNATALDACEAMAVIISGGRPPYRFFISSVSSIFYANVSLPYDVTAWAWVNDLATPQTLVFTAEDSEGNLAITSGGIASNGTAGRMCPTNSVALPFPPAGGYDTAGITVSRNTATIVGSVLGSVIFLMILAVVIFLLLRRRKRTRGRRVISAPVTPFWQRSMEHVSMAPYPIVRHNSGEASDSHRDILSRGNSGNSGGSGYEPDSSAEGYSPSENAAVPSGTHTPSGYPDPPHLPTAWPVYPDPTSTYASAPSSPYKSHFYSRQSADNSDYMGSSYPDHGSPTSVSSPMLFRSARSSMASNAARRPLPELPEGSEVSHGQGDSAIRALESKISEGHQRSMSTSTVAPSLYQHEDAGHLSGGRETLPEEIPPAYLRRS